MERTRPTLWRDRYRVLLRMALMEAAIILFLIAAIVIVLVKPGPADRQFVSSFDGRVIYVPAYDTPQAALEQTRRGNPATGDDIIRREVF
ncbi:MAG: hypothetical protein U9N14_07225 [Pseudomonadota bacterium]|nr:hypothetical protein [Pseudomonadota bacterium]